MYGGYRGNANEIIGFDSSKIEVIHWVPAVLIERY
jgi:hypothetical protein